MSGQRGGRFGGRVRRQEWISVEATLPSNAVPVLAWERGDDVHGAVVANYYFLFGSWASTETGRRIKPSHWRVIEEPGRALNTPQACACLYTDCSDRDLTWETSCGHSFFLAEGDLASNSILYCCFCGGRIAEAAE